MPADKTTGETMPNQVFAATQNEVTLEGSLGSEGAAAASLKAIGPADAEAIAEDRDVAAPTGHEVLDEVRDALSRFVAFPSEEALTAVTLWAAHTHALDAFHNTPRLAMLSPEPGSGKTRVLEILEILCPRPVMTVNTTPAYLFRRISAEGGPPTILFDEIDTVFGPSAKGNEDVRGLINAGYRRGATAGRCVVRNNVITTEDLPAFAALALAGLHDLPDTIMSRAVLIRMKKRAPNERVEPFRPRLHADALRSTRDRLAAWVETVVTALEEAWPDLPDGITDRSADVWEPLIAIADAAGGSWPERARVAAVALVALAQEREPGHGVRLLADIRDIFGTKTAMPTESMLEALLDLDESPWASGPGGKMLDARMMATLLSAFNIKSKSLRTGSRVVRGYERTSFEDPWERYLPSTAPETPEVTITDPEDTGSDAATPATPATGHSETQRTIRIPRPGATRR